MRHDTAYREVPGEFRTVQNWIGGLRIQDAPLVPPRPERIASVMEDLVGRVRRYEPAGNAYLHVIVGAALSHAQFETIHPFCDGNRRIGYLLIQLMLAAEGFHPCMRPARCTASSTTFRLAFRNPRFGRRVPPFPGPIRPLHSLVRTRRTACGVLRLTMVNGSSARRWLLTDP